MEEGEARLETLPLRVDILAIPRLSSDSDASDSSFTRIAPSQIAAPSTVDAAAPPESDR